MSFFDILREIDVLTAPAARRIPVAITGRECVKRMIMAAVKQSGCYAGAGQSDVIDSSGVPIGGVP